MLRHLIVAATISIASVQTICVANEIAPDRKAAEIYRIMNGDTLGINVFGEESQTGSFLVNSVGSIKIPYLNQLKVAGQTLEEAEFELKRQLSKIIKEPNVSIIIQNFNSPEISFYVFGEVLARGAHSVPRTARRGILQAIGSAGGFTENADQKEIQLIRMEGKPVTVNVERIFQGNDPPDLFRITDGDIIFVHPLTGALRSKRIFVTVLGQVTQPGTFELRGDAKLTEAIGRSILKAEAADEATLFRGGNPYRTINLTNLVEHGTLSENISLHDGDVFVVPKEKQVTVVGGVNKPGPLPLEGKTSILELLALAGGLITETRNSSVIIYRENGTQENINLDELNAGDLSLNKEIFAGDNIVVAGATPINVRVMGHVVKQGNLDLPPDSTLFSLISAAGGATENADLSSVSLIRQGTRQPINLIKLMNEGLFEDDLKLQDADMIHIPGLTQFMVLGAVNKPGPIPATPGLTLLDAIVMAGGTNEKSDLEQIKVVHQGTTESVNFILARLGDRSQNPGIYSSDIVIVPERDSIQVFGSVNSPGTYHIDVGSKASDVLKSAGGPTENAELRKAYVIREGTKAIKINLKKVLFKGDPSQDVVVKAGDMFWVPGKQPEGKFGFNDILGLAGAVTTIIWGLSQSGVISTTN